MHDLCTILTNDRNELTKLESTKVQPVLTAPWVVQNLVRFLFVPEHGDTQRLLCSLAGHMAGHMTWRLKTEAYSQISDLKKWM